MLGGVASAYELLRDVIGSCANTNKMNRLISALFQIFRWNFNNYDLPGSMLGHNSRSSVLLRFAKDNVNFGGKETGQLDNSASFEREKGLKKSIINVG